MFVLFCHYKVTSYVALLSLGVYLSNFFLGQALISPVAFNIPVFTLSGFVCR